TLHPGESLDNAGMIGSYFARRGVVKRATEHGTPCPEPPRIRHVAEPADTARCISLGKIARERIELLERSRRLGAGRLEPRAIVEQSTHVEPVGEREEAAFELRELGRGGEQPLL